MRLGAKADFLSLLVGVGGWNPTARRGKCIYLPLIYTTLVKHTHPNRHAHTHTHWQLVQIAQNRGSRLLSVSAQQRSWMENNLRTQIAAWPCRKFGCGVFSNLAAQAFLFFSCLSSIFAEASSAITMAAQSQTQRSVGNTLNTHTAYTLRGTCFQTCLFAPENATHCNGGRTKKLGRLSTTTTTTQMSDVFSATAAIRLCGRPGM